MPDKPTVRELGEKVDHLEIEQQAEKKQPEKPEKPKKPFAQRTRRYVKRHPGRVLLGAIALVLVLVGSALLWTYLSSYESTDDAEVDGHLNMISSRIAGTVVGVYVEDDQFVQPGQVIVDLDPRDYKVALEQAGGVGQRGGDGKVRVLGSAGARSETGGFAECGSAKRQGAERRGTLSPVGRQRGDLKATVRRGCSNG